MPLTPIQQSQVDVANTVGAEISYLNASNERHFDSVLWLYSFSAGLLSAFVTALITETGKATAQKMVERIKSLLGQPEPKQDSELSQLVSQLTTVLESQNGKDVEMRLEDTTKTLEQSLVLLGFPQAVASTKSQSIQKIVKIRLLSR